MRFHIIFQSEGKVILFIKLDIKGIIIQKEREGGGIKGPILEARVQVETNYFIGK